MMPLINIEAVWEYQETLNEVPVDLSLVSIPTIDWITGESPFGDGPQPIGLTEPNTSWTKATGLWIRRFVDVSGEKDILVKGNCEQAMFLFWDGEYVGTLNPDNEARTDVPEYRIIIPKNIALFGSHEIALLCLDDDSVLESSVCYISVEVDYLPVVFPLQPESPVLEKLSWLTDVSISRNGTEDRIKIGPFPRQEFNFSFPAKYEIRSRAQNILWGDLKNDILIPVWTQAVRLDSLSAGLNRITVDTRYSEFRNPGYAIIWSSPDNWQLVGVYDKSDTYLDISNITEAFSRCWVIPVRTAILPRGASKLFNGYNSSFNLDFMIKDNRDISVSEPDQYLGSDVYLEETLLSGDSLTEEFNIDLKLFDPGINLFSGVTGLSRTRSEREFRILCEDASSSWAFREFLNRRSGRYRSFRQPTFENDLRVVNSGTIVTSMEVMKDDYLRSSQSRNVIAIETDSEWLLREILDVSIIDETRMALELSSAINIVRQSIRRVCWLGLNRLDTDVVDISHIGAGVSSSSFRIVEIES